MTAKHLIVSILSLSILLGWNSQASADQQGKIQVVTVEGPVTVSGVDGSASKPLATGLTVQDGQRIVTGPGGRAVLLFDNGSIFTVEEKTTFDIQQFTIAPFDIQKVDYTKIKKEPSKSNTKVKVGKGTVLADVRKLNRSSNMDIATPVGVAGIRGTRVKTTVTQNADGSFSVNFAVPEGSVAVSGPGGQSFTVGEGAPNGANSLTFAATLNAQGELVLTGEPQYSTLTPAEASAITSAMSQSETDVSQSNPNGNPFTGPGNQQAPPPGNPPSGGQGGDQGTINNGGNIGSPSPSPAS